MLPKKNPTAHGNGLSKDTANASTTMYPEQEKPSQVRGLCYPLTLGKKRTPSLGCENARLSQYVRTNLVNLSCLGFKKTWGIGGREVSESTFLRLTHKFLDTDAEAGELGLSFVAVAFSNVTVVSSNDILGQVISEVCYAQTTSAVGG